MTVVPADVVEVAVVCVKPEPVFQVLRSVETSTMNVTSFMPAGFVYVRCSVPLAGAACGTFVRLAVSGLSCST